MNYGDMQVLMDRLSYDCWCNYGILPTEGECPICGGTGTSLVPRYKHPCHESLEEMANNMVTLTGYLRNSVALNGYPETVVDPLDTVESALNKLQAAVHQ